MTTNIHEQEIEALRAVALRDLDAAHDADALEKWRIGYLGRSGKLTMLLRGVASLSPEARRVVGAAGNQLKSLLETRHSEKTAALQHSTSERLAELDQIDITLPGRSVDMGRLHIISRVTRDICGIFQDMGFRIAEGPEIEWDRYNFELMNMPKDHPARDKFNSFFVDYKDKDGNYPIVPRTHTSPMQARVMEQQDPPVRVVVPGKVYRYEATDATHESQFFQVEGLVVDKGITLANLKHTLYEFAKRMFGADRKVRFRCDFFPFVEPGVDMSVDCFACEGRGDPGCKVCRGSGWLEIMGAGMVHPEVLRMVGYDPAIYTGFAFGMGPERIAILKYGIDDIRLFYANDLRFLRQY